MSKKNPFRLARRKARRELRPYAQIILITLACLSVFGLIIIFLSA